MATSALSEVSFTVCCVSCVPLGALNWKHLIIFVGRLSRGLRQRPYFRCSQVRTHLLHSSLTTLLSSPHTLLTLYSRTLALSHRFKYPPYWVPMEKIWESMAVEDKATGQPRGYFIVRSSR